MHNPVREGKGVCLLPWTPAQPLGVRLKLHCLTYNMNSVTLAPIPVDLLYRSPCAEIPNGSLSDLYAVATQENASGAKWEKEWETALGREYKKIAAVNLASVHLVVFLHSHLIPLLCSVATSKVATGVGNLVGNKGGVAASLIFVGQKKLLLVSSHLAAHDRKVKARNEDFNRIRLGLFHSGSTPLSSPRSQPKRNQVASISTAQSCRASLTSHQLQPEQDVLDEHHVIVWMGDLNYRVKGNRRIVQHALESGMHEVLLANDQLRHEQRRGNVFRGFKEGAINFPPTYKFDKLSDVYDTSSKFRIPSWTDRILWKTCQMDNQSVCLVEYCSVSSIKASDHRPVLALFDIDLGKIRQRSRTSEPPESTAGHLRNKVLSRCGIQ